MQPHRAFCLGSACGSIPGGAIRRRESDGGLFCGLALRRLGRLRIDPPPAPGTPDDSLLDNQASKLAPGAGAPTAAIDRLGLGR